MSSIHRLLLIVACLAAIACWSVGAGSTDQSCVLTKAALLSRGGASESSGKEEKSPKSKKWSSFFTVDPSKILKVLINRGGLLIPKSVEKELMALRRVLHVKEASLNLVERQLIVKNFTVSVPGSNTESLLVGRVHVRWDSYTKPCVDIEVDDVGVLVEFTNLMLTRSNWNELEDAGFPPTMEEDSDPSAPSSTFVRIGSIRLSGNVTSEIRSRPLDRTIANMSFGMNAFDNLSKEISQNSEANLAATGRRGCTTDEMYEIVRVYFMKRIRKFLQETAYDVSAGSLSEDGSNTVREAKKLFASASSMIKNYADDASKKTGNDIQASFANRLEKLGMPSSREKVSALRELSANIDARNLAGSQLARLREAYKNSRVDTDSFVGNEALMYTTRSDEPVHSECEDDDSNGKGDSSNPAAATAKGAEKKETIIIFPEW